MPKNIPLFPTIDESLCLGFDRCGACGAVCPGGWLPVGEADSPQGERTCTLCAACEDVCPAGAVSVPFTIGWINNQIS